jgi:branched-chain amino acid transport system permease protein
MEFFVQQLANGIMMGSIYVLMALGLVLILSMMDLVNFSHGQLVMVGGYIMLVLMNAWGVPFFIAIFLTFVSMAGISFVIEKSIIRPTRLNKLPLLIAGIATVGLAMVIEEVMVLLFGMNPRAIQAAFGTQPISIGFLRLSLMRLLIPVLVIFMVVGLMLFLYKTYLGKSLRAVAQDSEAAALQGINVDAAMTLGFVISCGLAAVAGTFIAQMMPLDPYMGLQMSLKGFAIIIVGGMMSLWGAILASYLLGIGEVLISGYLGANFKEIFFFGAMVLILLLKPSGLLAGAQDP